jgi:hypothetical protein
MKRRLFNLAAAVSLVVMLAMVVLWIRSYSVQDIVWIARPGNTFMGEVATSRGNLVVGLLIDWRALDEIKSCNLKLATTSIWHDANPVTPDNQVEAFHTNVRHTFLGIGYSRSWSVNDTDVTMDAPLWLMSLMTAMLPAVALRRRLVRRRRHEPGKYPCERCGYDLRATPDRCPECGMEAKESVGARVRTE